MIHRRHILQAGAGLAGLQLLKPLSAFAATDDMRAAIVDMFGGGQIQSGRLNLSLPPLSENGYSVSLDVEADSPMTAQDYVKRIGIFSDRNPIPLIAEYYLTPASGRAKVSGKVRLAGTQSLHAVAEMSDGTLWGASAKTIVTVAACVIL